MINEINVLTFPTFTICLVPKVASTSLTGWDTGIKTKVQVIDSINFNKPVYAFWRPAYDRILSGFHTDLNVRAYKDVGDEYTNEHYYQQFHMWRSNEIGDFSINMWHCRLLQTIFGRYIDNISFIHISQIDWLHLYLNRIYDLNFPAVLDINSKDIPRDGPNKLAFSALSDILLGYPGVYTQIAHYAAMDYIPKKFINILAL